MFNREKCNAVSASDKTPPWNTCKPAWKHFTRKCIKLLQNKLDPENLPWMMGFYFHGVMGFSSRDHIKFAPDFHILIKQHFRVLNVTSRVKIAAPFSPLSELTFSSMHSLSLADAIYSVTWVICFTFVKMKANYFQILLMGDTSHL